MNKVEALYAAYLQERKDAGQIADFRYEAVTLKLADNTRYTPDFMVLGADYSVQFHEVKGREGNGPGGWMDDAKVKIKVAAHQFPWFVFVGACAVPKKRGGGFVVQMFSREET